jgi:hypothetical protein
VDPAINRNQVGIKDSNIQIIPGPVDLDALLELHGSGSYHLKFNDQNRKPAQRAKCTVTLEDPTRPPNLNPAELVIPAPAKSTNDAVLARYLNMGWTVAEKTNDLLPSGFRTLVPPAAAAPAAAGASGVDKALVDLLRDNLAARAAAQGSDFDRALVLAKQIQAPPDPVTARLAQATIDRITAPPPPPPAAAAPVDPFEHIERMGRFFTSMGWAPPGQAAAAAPASDGGSLIETIKALPKLLEHGTKFLTQLMTFRMMAAAGQVPAAPGLGGMVPAFAPAAAAPLAAAPEDEGEEGEEVEEGEEGEEDAMLAQLKLIEVGKMALGSIQSGQTGDQFAASLLASKKYRLVYLDLVDAGREGIEQYLALIPGMAAKIAPYRSRVDPWLTSFLAYGGGGAAPAAAAPAGQAPPVVG